MLLAGWSNGRTGRLRVLCMDAALRAKGTIVLVDGKMLTRLMVEHEVGVTHKALRVPKVDGDFLRTRLVVDR